MRERQANLQTAACCMRLCMYARRVVDALRVRLGGELRALREGSGLSGSTVGARLGWSQSKVSRVETARFGATLGEVAELVGVFDVPDDVRAELLSLAARASGVPGAWVIRAGGSGRRQAQVAALESRLTRLRQYHALGVPGLLQVPAYTRALAAAIGYGDPDALVDRRQARQAVIRECEWPGVCVRSRRAGPAAVARGRGHDDVAARPAAGGVEVAEGRSPRASGLVVARRRSRWRRSSCTTSGPRTALPWCSARASRPTPTCPSHRTWTDTVTCLLSFKARHCRRLPADGSFQNCATSSRRSNQEGSRYEHRLGISCMAQEHPQ